MTKLSIVIMIIVVIMMIAIMILLHHIEGVNKHGLWLFTAFVILRTIRCILLINKPKL